MLAQADGVELNFELEPSPRAQYDPSFDLNANDFINDGIDSIVGDYFSNPERTRRIDFTPTWL